MNRILRTYVIREIALPTMISLLTVTFLLLARHVYDLISLLMAPGVSIGQVLDLLALLLPSILVFGFPMALLIGSLIGVGRMTLDHEVLAIRASGINLFSVFAPALGLAMAASVLIFWVSSGFVPRTMQAWMTRVDQMKLALVNALEPGRFYDDLLGGNMIFYFSERDQKTGAMRGITLEMAKSVIVNKPGQAPGSGQASNGSSASRPATDKNAPQATPGPAGAAVSAKQAGGKKGASSEARDAQGHAVAQAPKSRRVAVKTPKSSGAPNATRSTKPKTPAVDKRTELTLVFAKSSAISIQRRGALDDPNAESEVMLTLKEGTIHQLSADPVKPDYAVVSFERLDKRLFSKAEIEKPYHTFDSRTLKSQIDQQMKLPASQRAKILGSLCKELWQRRAMWLATFVFALLGIPLAIWVRPSGKSWGILIAIGMMLVYYVILQIGLSMVQEFSPAGVVVTMAPNVLYAILGVALWRNALRS